MKTDNRPSSILKYSGITIQFLVAIGLSVFIGIKADAYLNWSVPVVTITLPLIVIVFSLYQLIRSLSKKDRHDA